MTDTPLAGWAAPGCVRFGCSIASCMGPAWWDAVAPDSSPGVFRGGRARMGRFIGAPLTLFGLWISLWESVWANRVRRCFSKVYDINVITRVSTNPLILLPHVFAHCHVTVTKTSFSPKFGVAAGRGINPVYPIVCRGFSALGSPLADPEVLNKMSSRTTRSDRTSLAA
jgi:hypothetical protein